MIKIDEAVIVEGRYDKIRLSSILDAFIVETNGFGIYKDKKRLEFIRRLAEERGIILVTDSDRAGFQIRSYIAAGIPKEKIKHIYIPDIFGKEKRKKQPSAEGKLGVEGISEDVLERLFKDLSLKSERVVKENKITKYDLYAAGLSGAANSAQKRKKLLKALDLPEFLSANSLLSYLNFSMSKEEFENYITAI